MSPPAWGRQTTVPLRRSLLISVVAGALLLGSACQFGPGVEPVTTLTVSPDATPPPTHAADMCAVIDAHELAQAVAAEARALAGASTERVCTYEVRGVSAPYQIATRVEDGFESIDAVRSVFAGGSDVDGLGGQAYWAPEVAALWVEKAGVLYAVQLIQFGGTAEEAAEIATAVATLLE
jgi:hypothetical protein